MFENLILFLIITSSIMLIIDDPLEDPDSMKTKIMSIIDILHTVLFTIEAMIKIIGLGFFKNNFKGNDDLKPYFMQIWNIIDFLVVVASLTELILPTMIDIDQNNI